MTKLNNQILEMINNSSGHLSADEAFNLALEKKINISKSSMYRILNKLYEEGLISKFIRQDKIDIYDKSIHEHEHLICEKCGEVKDFKVNNIKKILKKETGVDINFYELHATYICEKCKNKLAK